MVNKRLFLTILLFFCSFSTVFAANYSKDASNLTIFSESNMIYPLTKIVREYSKKENIAISVNFNSSSALIENIDLGEPADIFISSHSDWVKNLSQKGLVDQFNLANFAKDRLVLVTSKKNKKIDLKNIDKIKNLSEMLKLISKKRAPLIIGSNYSSLGRYTTKIIDDSHISNFQIFRKLDEDKKSITDFINENNDYCAIVMESEIKNNDKIITLIPISEIIIDYQALVIAGHNMDNARKFIKFLESPEARNILINDGFLL